MRAKLYSMVAILIITLVVSVTATPPMTIPTSDTAKENAMAPDNSPVIDENWVLTPGPYYVYSDNPTLRALLGANQDLPGGVFSTELTKTELKLLKAMGIKTEPVAIFQIRGRPVCGDGVCQGSEPKTCPEDCQSEQPEPCFPSTQKPWGVVKVNGSSGGAGVTVAVLDTGVDTDHPDLVGNIKDCLTEVTHFKPDMGSCEDKNGHGTHVAGTVAADAGSSGLGIYGVAPEASLMVVKVCDKRGFCYGDDAAAGIYYAADNGANIISMSFGGNSPDSRIIAAIDYAVSKGVLVVAAAGNDGPSYGSIDYPGAYHKVIAAGAIDVSEAVPDWSSRGVNDGDFVIEEKEVEFGAPGVSVESTYNDGCYTHFSGTSMATPHVSGLAAKLWQGNAADTRSYLQSVARDIWTAGDDTATGFGLPAAP